MKPSLGRIVHYYGHSSNGTDTHPAIITRVWSDTCVNLTVFPDFGEPILRTSIIEIQPDAVGSVTVGWFWPPRVDA